MCTPCWSFNTPYNRSNTPVQRPKFCPSDSEAIIRIGLLIFKFRRSGNIDHVDNPYWGTDKNNTTNAWLFKVIAFGLIEFFLIKIILYRYFCNSSFSLKEQVDITCRCCKSKSFQNWHTDCVLAAILNEFLGSISGHMTTERNQ